MIFIVTGENRHLFETELAQMHRQRKAVFIDELGWNVPAIGGMEIDAYDHANTIYLLLHDEARSELLASARLFPTTQPHLMTDVFAHLCALPPPTGPLIWEASRFCATPALAGRRRLEVLWQILAGVMETCLLFGIEQIVFTANRAFLPLAMQCGWEARTLGNTVADGDDHVTPVCVQIHPTGLRSLRRRFGIEGPITRFVTPRLRVAA